MKPPAYWHARAEAIRRAVDYAAEQMRRKLAAYRGPIAPPYDRGEIYTDPIDTDETWGD